MSSSDCIWFSLHINGKAPQIVTHVKCNCCERCAWASSERDVHFNTIVRDLFAWLFDKIWLRLNYSWMTNCVKWENCAISGLKSSFCWFHEILVNDVIDIETKSMRKPQEIKNILAWRSRFTRFLWSLKKQILQFCRWQNENIRERKEKTRRRNKISQTLFMHIRTETVNKAKNYFNDIEENALNLQ